MWTPEPNQGGIHHLMIYYGFLMRSFNDVTVKFSTMTNSRKVILHSQIPLILGQITNLGQIKFSQIFFF